MKIIAMIILGLLVMGCSKDNPVTPEYFETEFVTMIEIGSDTCEDCVRMRDVMASLEVRYGDDLLIEFIDILKNYEESKKYKIVVMPTQVFLNDKGEEIHRHEGYYPEEEIDEFLAKCRIEPIN